MNRLNSQRSPASGDTVSSDYPTVLISVLNWNSLETTRRCLRSIASLDYPQFDVTIVDNGSIEDESAVLAQEFPFSRILRSSRNLGFAGGHNLAINGTASGRYEFVWLLNNDCTVHPKDLRALVDLAQLDSRIGIVSPLIVVPVDGSPPRQQFSGAWFDWLQHECVRPLDPQQVRAQEQATPSNMWVAGTAMLIRREMFDEIGGLDERYFAYFEDTEFGARASKAGYVSRIAFDVKVEHHSYTSTHMRPPYYFYLCNRNAWLFWTENTPPAFRTRLIRRLIGRTLLEALTLRRAGLRPHAHACIVGLTDGMRGRYGNIRTQFDPDWFADMAARLVPWRLAAWLAK